MKKINREYNSPEFNIIKNRYGISKVFFTQSMKADSDCLYILDTDEILSDDFFLLKPNYMTVKEVETLSEASELVVPEIPMLINTIENAYARIAVYGTSDYAQKIYDYLSKNPYISVVRIDEAQLIYQDKCYLLKNEESIEMLLIMDLIACNKVEDTSGEEILTVFAKKMYYTNLKSTGNNLDINTRIIPKLVENHIQVLWIGVPNLQEIYRKRRVGLMIRFWSFLRKKNEKAFNWLRHKRFHTDFLTEESMAVVNSNVKGISEVFFNGQYINCEGGFRKTPGNSNKAFNKIWLFGPCYVRGLNFDDNHTMSAKLQAMVSEQYNVINRGTVNTCLNYAMRMSEFKSGDIVVFFSPDSVPVSKHPNITYLDMTSMIDTVPHLERHITDSVFHCDEIVIDAMVNGIFSHLNQTDNLVGTDSVYFGSLQKRVPSLNMYMDNEFIKWINKLSDYKQVGKCGAIVMNANPFTNGHLYLVEYAARRVDCVYIFVVEEDSSFFSFHDRMKLVEEGTKNISNVIVLPSSQYIVSKSSLPGYFKKESMNTDYKLDATQDLLAFAQVAKELDIQVRFAGEEPLDPYTNQYNENMSRILPKYGIEFETIPRKQNDDVVISASLVRKCLEEGNLQKIRDFVPQSTYVYLQKYKDG